MAGTKARWVLFASGAKDLLFDEALLCFVDLQCTLNDMLSQVDNIKTLCDEQSWEGIQIVHDLPGRGRGVKATRQFVPNEVVCDYHGQLLQHKEGKDKYESSPEHAMGYMFQFTFRGVKMWIDATDEKPGPGRLINHSRCHGNVRTHHCSFRIYWYDNYVMYFRICTNFPAIIHY